ncbi:MAG TPA: ABC transporter permease [Afifellaceae bacterium]|nr:ABC transporter permease [Afifellaceae bacterium]
MLRLLPAAAFVVLIGPVLAGLAGAVVPALGYLPVLGGDALSLEPFRDLLAMPGLARSCLLSLCAGLVTTAVSFLLVMAFVAGWRGTRVFRVLERLISPLLSVPHAAAAFGLAFLIAPSGFLARLVSPWLTGWERPPDILVIHDGLALSMMAGLITKEVPFLLLVTLAALPQVNAAGFARINASLGYGRMAGFAHTILPLLYRQIRLPIFAVIAYSSSVVDVALILGPTTPPPLAVRIVEWLSDPDLSMRFVAAAAAVLQLGVTLAALAVWWGAERLVIRLWRARLPSGRRGLNEHLVRQLAATGAALSAAAVLTGILILLVWSLAGFWRFPDLLPQSFGLKTWMRILPVLTDVMGNAILIGFASSLLATVLALGALEYEARAGTTPTVRALVALYLPLLVPQIAFLFGLQIVLTRLSFDGTFAALVLGHLIFVFPYVLLSLADPWRNWDARYGHMGRALGHGADAIFWRIRLPMLVRPVLTAAAVGFAVSVGQYLPTLLIGAGRWPTITTEAVALASGGNRQIVGATALLQAVLPFIGFALALVVPALLFRNRREMRAA